MSGRYVFSPEDRALLERLVTAIENSLNKETRRKGFWERFATPITIGVSALALVVSVWVAKSQLAQSSRQLAQSSSQFDRTQRQGQYSDIVAGLASSSVAVQVNSIRRLVQYVVERSNFDSNQRQVQAAVNAAQTLAAFIEDESSIPGHDGLSDYNNPQPVVVARAVGQLVALTGLKRTRADTKTFPQADVDLAHGNFHGIGVADFVPRGGFYAVGADFRAATVTGWDLTKTSAQPNLSDAFFTCANLQRSNLGTANVAAADFTGADLRGANLSHVKNLEAAQLRGALVGPDTLLPRHVKRPRNGWGVTEVDGRFVPSLACRSLLDRMTNLPAGSGFSPRLRCPAASPSPWAIRLSRPEHRALDRVCHLRAKLQRTDGQQTTALQGPNK